MAEISELIASLGFPIACVIGMAYFVWKLWDKQSTDNSVRENRLYDEIAKCREINNKAIETIHSCVERLGIIQNDIEDIKNDVHDLKKGN